MIDALSQVGLVGTDRQPLPIEDPPSPAAEVLAALSELPAPRRVLLAAGARAIATRAGVRPLRVTAPGRAAEPETLPTCSPRAAQMIGALLEGDDEPVSVDACDLVGRAGQRLPYSLLLTALSARGWYLRRAIRPILGQRGLWMSTLNDAWDWVRERELTSAVTLAELETAWNEGTGDRAEVLRRAREMDSAVARGWLEATWAKEKAEARASLIGAMNSGLTPEDEPFLEAQLRDRAVEVRKSAQAFLKKLPTSAYSRRMIARADRMINLDAHGAMVIELPEKMSEEDERDGLGKPSGGVGAKAYWLTKTLDATPISHWSERFALPPEELVRLASKTDWVEPLLEGWIAAALLAEDRVWFAGIWDFLVVADAKTINPELHARLVNNVVYNLAPAEREARVNALLARPEMSPQVKLVTVLDAIPSPWPESVARAFVEKLHERAVAHDVSPFQELFSKARVALPHGTFDRLRELAVAPSAAGATARLYSPNAYVDRAFENLLETLRLRHELAQEIHP